MSVYISHCFLFVFLLLSCGEASSNLVRNNRSLPSVSVCRVLVFQLPVSLPLPVDASVMCCLWSVVSGRPVRAPVSGLSTFTPPSFRLVPNKRQVPRGLAAIATFPWLSSSYFHLKPVGKNLQVINKGNTVVTKHIFPEVFVSSLVTASGQLASSSDLQ